jgi:copper chaperone CopZ
MLIDMTVGDLPGVSSAMADYAKGTTHVDFDPSVISAKEIVDAITAGGYTAEVAA